MITKCFREHGKLLFLLAKAYSQAYGVLRSLFILLFSAPRVDLSAHCSYGTAVAGEPNFYRNGSATGDSDEVVERVARATKYLMRK